MEAQRLPLQLHLIKLQTNMNNVNLIDFFSFSDLLCNLFVHVKGFVQHTERYSFAKVAWPDCR